MEILEFDVEESLRHVLQGVWKRLDVLIEELFAHRGVWQSISRAFGVDG